MPSDRVSQVEEISNALGAGAAALRSLRQRHEAFTEERREQQDKQEERASANRRSTKDVFLDVIDLLDRLDRWLNDEEAGKAQEDPAAAQWVGRLDMMSKLAAKLLAKRNVVPLDLLTAPAGTVTVIDRVIDPDAKEETVDKVLERGWLWKGEVLRKASVVVKVPPDQADDVAISSPEDAETTAAE